MSRCADRTAPEPAVSRRPFRNSGRFRSFLPRASPTPDTHPMPIARRLPVGAEVTSDGVHVRVWAPKAGAVAVVSADGAESSLRAEPDGHFSGLLEGAGHGARYRLRLDGREPLADPV